MLQRSREGLIRAILHQVLEQRPDLASIIVGSQRINLEMIGLRRALDHKEWTWPELKAAFERLLTHRPASLKLMLFVDGLDEYRFLTRYDDYDYNDGDDLVRTELIVRGHEIADLFR